MSFVEQDDIFTIAESYAKGLVAELVPEKSITVDFQRIPYHEAQERYGSDKPDLRFGMEFVDISSLVESSDFGVFSNAVKD